MEWCIILTTVLFILGVSTIMCAYWDKTNSNPVGNWLAGFCGAIFFFSAVGFAAEGNLIKHPENKVPKAIDVYNGKTELQITSVNGIPTDTTVVWKKGMWN